MLIWVYISVVLLESWPKISWMYRISTPCSSKWVANECLKGGVVDICVDLMCVDQFSQIKMPFMEEPEFLVLVPLPARDCFYDFNDSFIEFEMHLILNSVRDAEKP